MKLKENLDIKEYLKNIKNDFFDVKKFKISLLIEKILEDENRKNIKLSHPNPPLSLREGIKKEEIENIFNNFLDNIIETDNYEKICDECVEKIERQKQDTFNIIDNLWYEVLKEKIQKNYSFKKFIEEIWKEKASMFFYWYVLESNADLDEKEYFLDFVINNNSEKKYNLFSKEQMKKFATFVIENKLIWNFYGKLINYINFLEEDFLDEKYADFFVYYKVNNKIAENKKIIDFVFENSTKIFWSIEKAFQKGEDWIVDEKINFDEIIQYLIENERIYFFQKLNSLEEKEFQFISQNLLNETITKSFNLENNLKKEDQEKLDTEKKLFLEKLERIWIKNIKHSIKENNFWSWYFFEKDKKNNFFNLLFEYKPELFTNTPLDLIMWNNSNIPTFILDKIPETIAENFKKLDKIDYWDLEKNPWKVVRYDYEEVDKNLFIQPEIIEHIVKNFSEKEVINYLFFLYFRTDIYYLDNYWDILEKIFSSKITKKSESEKIIKILENEQIFKFIFSFNNNFNNFSDILESKEIELLLTLEYKTLQKLLKFIELTKKIENIKINLKLENIDKNFINFVENNFRDFLWSCVIDMENEEKNIFFDVQIDSLDFFENKIWEKKIDYENEENLEKAKKNTQIQNAIFYWESDILDNMKEIFKIFNLEQNVSNFIKVEENFNNFLWTNKQNYVFLNSFLSQYISNFWNILKYFKKIHKKELNINEFLLIIKDTDFRKIDINKIVFFDKILDDFDAKNLIKIDWNNVSYSEDFQFLRKDLIENIWDYYYLQNVLKYLPKFNKEKLINFLEFVYNKSKNLNLEEFIWVPSAYNDKKYRKNEPVISYVINRILIKKAVLNNDFSKLQNQIDDNFMFFKENKYIDFDIKKIEENLENILKCTNWFLSKQLVQSFIFDEIYYNNYWRNKVNYKDTNNIIKNFDKTISDKKSYPEKKFLNLENTSKKFENTTWIKLKPEDFKDDIILTFLRDNKVLDENFINFFEKIPILELENETREWKIKDFKEWWILQKIFENIDISNKLINEKNFNLKDLEEFFSYNLDYNLIKKHQKEIFSYSKWIYYWYFVESRKYSYKLHYSIENNFPVNYDNFIDFMENDEKILEFEQDEWLEFEWIKPWTKAWFLEKTERKNYLKENYLKNFYEYWTLIWLWFIWEDFSKYIKDSKKIKLSKELQFCKQNFNFDIKELISYKWKWKDKKFVFKEDILKDYEKKYNFIQSNIDNKDEIIKLIKEDENLLNIWIKWKNFLKLSELLWWDLEAINNIFNVKSNWSLVLDNLLEKLKNNPEKTLLQIMKENVDEIFEKKVEWQGKYKEKEILENWKKITQIHKKVINKKWLKYLEKMWIKSDKLELALYLRYNWDNLNHPVIAEFIILFLEKYIRNWYSKYFSSIRIIPRQKDIFPSKEVLDSDIITKYNVSWKKDFPLALHVFGVPSFLSHSTNSALPSWWENEDFFKKKAIKKYKYTPSIISSWMEYVENSNDVVSKIELEDRINDLSKTMNLKEILSEIFENLIDIQKELDKLS